MPLTGADPIDHNSIEAVRGRPTCAQSSRDASIIGTNLRAGCSLFAATLLGFSGIFVHTHGVHMMTAAYLRTRSPRPLANKARTIAHRIRMQWLQPRLQQLGPYRPW
jgi:hypothetical protein